MQRVAIYLRKSRMDEEGDTLAKHKKTLLEFAKLKGLNVLKIHEEIVSGATIEDRPAVQALLTEVEEGLYDAVLVMDIDRLGRGNMMDQGIIFDTFQRTNTLIITPQKTYDLNNEIDEEYSEFLAFMARKELKLIKRRMEAGKIRSVSSGNYAGSHAPYGYDIKKDNTSRYLVINDEEAEVVKQIYQWYTSDDPKERMGTFRIAQKLNEMGIKTKKGHDWQIFSVLDILKNEVYIGRIQYRKKKVTKSRKPGKKYEKQWRSKEEWIDVEGKHEPIISVETFEKAKAIREKRNHAPISNGSYVNPLAGLVRCGMCGYLMTYNPQSGGAKPRLRCNRFCGNKSVKFDEIEKAIITKLEEWLEWFKITLEPQEEQNNHSNDLKLKALEKLKSEKEEYTKQKEKLYDFLERGIYDEETFLRRSTTLTNTIKELEEKIEKLEREIEEEKKRENLHMEIIPQIENALKLYQDLEDPKHKNMLLKEILDVAIYKREKKKEDFELTLYPKI